MAITFAKAFGSQGMVAINDFYAGQAADTNTTNTFATAGAYTPKKGDIVALNDQGRVSKAVTTTGNITATKVLGLCEGGEFQGLAQGGVYAAKAANSNSMTSGTIAKVNDNLTSSVFRIDLKSGATAPVVGKAYTIYIDTNQGAVLDTSNPASTTQLFQVTEYDSNNAGAFGNGECFGIIVAANVEEQA